MTDRLKKLLKPSRGAGMADYAILIALISLLSLVGVVMTGGSVKKIFNTAEEYLPDGTGEYVLPGTIEEEPDIALDYDLPPGSMVLAFEGQTVALYLEKGEGEAFVHWRERPELALLAPGLYSYTFAEDGLHYVGVSGDVSLFRSESNNLVEVLTFGKVPLTSLERTFEDDTDLLSVSALPGTVTSLAYSFASSDPAQGPNPAGLEAWDTSNVADFSYTFFRNGLFNQDIATWSVAAADRDQMKYMLDGATGFVGDLGDWCVEHITTQPISFGAPYAERPPIWGHCGTPEAKPNPDALIFTVSGSSTNVTVSGGESGPQLATVFWGDGSIETTLVNGEATWNASHSYAEDGTYQVQIEMAGSIDYFRVTEDTVVSVDQWGTGLTTLDGSFAKMSRLASVPPLPGTITSLYQTFQGDNSSGPNPAGVGEWDVSRVTNMKQMFQGNPTFSQDVSGWDIDAINALGNNAGRAALESAFQNAIGISADLGDWCVDQISQAPVNFGAPNAERQPVWGHCGTPEEGDNPDALRFTVQGATAKFSASGADGNWNLATVFWGDGSVSTAYAQGGHTPTFSHDYAEAGTYEVQVEMGGNVDYFRVLEDTVVSVEHWGPALTSLSTSFAGMVNIASLPPIPETVTDLTQAFLGNGAIGANPAGLADWDVSHVTNMKETFKNNPSFDQDISGWDISAINALGNTPGRAALDSVFNGATGLTADLGEWCVDEISQQPVNFGAPNAARQPVWGHCGTPEPQDNPDALRFTVQGASAKFMTSGADGNWNLATVYWGDGSVSTTYAQGGHTPTFSHEYAEAGTYQVQVEMGGNVDYFRVLEDTVVSVENWGPALTSLSTGFAGMLKIASLPPLPATVSDLTQVFVGNGAIGPNPAGVGAWDVSNVTSMKEMFKNNPSFDQDVSGWDISAINALGNTSGRAALDSIFSGANGVTSDLGNWCVENLLTPPANFGADNAARQPTWGYCGTPEVQDNPDALRFTVEGSSAKFLASGTGGQYELATVYWGDGAVSTAYVHGQLSQSFSHDYAEHGTYQVQVEMAGNADYFRVQEDTVVSVENWGPALTSLSSSFSGMTKIASLPPLPATVTNLTSTFQGSGGTGPNPPGIGDWDVSRVTSMKNLFASNPRFDQDVSGWDISAINALGNNSGQAALDGIFNNASGMTSDLGSWCVDKLLTPPSDFGAPNAERQPTWGHCGTPEAQDNPDALRFTVAGSSAQFLASGTGGQYELATVYWGDGAVSTAYVHGQLSKSFSHDYAVPGTYQVQVEMGGNADYFRVQEDTVVSVDQWGPSLTSLSQAFSGMTKITSLPPLPTTVTNLTETFRGTGSDGANPPGIGDWDVSRVTSMTNMFLNNPSFDQDVSGWDISAINALGTSKGQTALSGVFNNATGITADLANWCVDNIIAQPSNFGAPNAERQPVWGYCGMPEPQENPDALIFTVDGGSIRFYASGVQSGLATIYWGDGTIDTTSIAHTYNWDVSHSYAEPGLYTVQVEMAGSADFFRPLEGTVVSVQQWGPSISSLLAAFSGNSALEALPPLPSSVKYLESTFQGANGQGPNPPGIGSWDVSRVVKMKNLFKDNPSFDQDVSNWDLSAINALGDANGRAALEGIFHNATGVTSDLSTWCVDQIMTEPVNFGAPNAVKQPAWGYCGWPAFDDEIMAEALAFKIHGSSVSLYVDAREASTIHWGIDGKTKEIAAGFAGTVNFSYGLERDYLVQITGGINRFTTFSDNLISVEQWGNVGINSLVGLGAGDTELASVPDHLPAGVTNVYRAFQNGGNPTGLETWDVSGVTNMNEMFRGNTRFTGDLSNWCVTQFSTEPSLFEGWGASGRPAWGYCGQPGVEDVPEATILTVEGASATLRMRSFDSGSGMILWGDGQSTTTSTSSSRDADYTHSYADTGPHQVMVLLPGQVKYFRTLEDTVVSVEQFSPKLNSLYYAFSDASKLQRLPDTLPANLVSLHGAFAGANGPNPEGISGWDTAGVTNMDNLANGNTAFNADVSAWDVSNVTTMTGAFNGASGFTGHLKDWCVEKIPSQPSGFGADNAASHPAWGYCGTPELAALPDATIMTVDGASASFRIRPKATGSGLILWGDGQTSTYNLAYNRIDTISHSYAQAGEYQVAFIVPGHVDYIQVTEDTVVSVDQWSPTISNLYYAFNGMSRLAYVAPLRSEVGTMAGIFGGVSGPNPDGLAAWDVSSVTNMKEFARDNASFNGDIAGWDVSNVSDMSIAFYGATGFTGDLSEWCVTKITSEPSSFGAPNAAGHPAWGYCGTPDLENAPEATIVTIDGDSASFMVRANAAGTGLIMWGDGQTQTISVTLGSNYAVSHDYAEAGTYQAAIFMPGQLYYFRSLVDTLVSVDQFNPELRSLGSAFRDMSRLASVAPLPSKVTILSNAFAGANGPNPSGLEAWDTSAVLSMDSLAADNPNFNADVSGWDISKVTALDYAFNGATGFNGHLKDWCATRFTTTPTGFGAPNAASHPAWGYCGAPEADETAMVLTVEGDSAALRLQPVSSGSHLILWGDGQTEAISRTAGQDWLPVHDYAQSGTYQVTIFLNGGVRHFRAVEDTVTRVDQWASNTQYVDHAFNGKSAISYVAPIPGTVLKTASMFAGVGADGHGANPVGIGAWNMSSTTDLSNMFDGNPDFDQDISDWDVSSATNMNYMFRGADGFTGDLGKWCVSKFSAAPAAFGAANAERLPNWGFCGTPDPEDFYRMTVNGSNMELYLETRSKTLVDWGDGTSQVVNSGNAGYVNHTFPSAGTYQVSIFGEVSRVTNRHTNKIMVSTDGWGKVGLKSIKYGFSNETGIVSLPGTLPPTVTDMFAAFKEGSNVLDVEGWDVSNVTNMDSLFEGNTAFTGDLSGWCVPNIRSEPANFGAPNAIHPNWGTCPGGQ